MSEPQLRIVVVLYRSRLSRVRSLLERLAGSRAVPHATVVVAINKDGWPQHRLRRRRVALSPDLTLEVHVGANVGGVTSAYNRVIHEAAPDDILVLLDGDSRPPASYFDELWSQRELLLAGLNFVSPQLFSHGVRVSPYGLEGMRPRVITGALDATRRFEFAEHVGVINAALAGSVQSFRAVAGFSSRINLDLSDVLWSIRAARAGASLTLLPTAHTHELSMFAGGFAAPRLRRYLLACWRLGGETRDITGCVMMCARGIRAFVRGLWLRHG
jgi:GT2 family glycosyltransferase